MKKLTTWIMTAAALAVAVTSASAQTTLKADIPFAFRAGQAGMESGAYKVVVNHNGIVSLYNEDTRQGALANAAVPQDPPKEWKTDGLPRLAFECGEGPCVLRKVWTADGSPAHGFATPKPHGETHLVMIPLTVVKR